MAKPKQTFMRLAYPTGGRATGCRPALVNLLSSRYKQIRDGIGKSADAPERVRHLTFKPEKYSAT